MIESRRFTNPFPGLRPFETEEYRVFFGREGQSDALITRLQRTRLLAVVGTSGSGKSSLIRAGLLPALCGGMMADAGSGWRIAILRPGNNPFSNLAHSLAEKHVMPEAGGGLPAAEAEAVIEATLRRGSLGLVDVARQARLTEREKLLVVIDQFEELFRFRAARETTSTDDDASAFVKLLLEAAHQRELSLYVVLTMRSDFLGDCAQFQGLPEAINDGQYLIPRMTRDERRMAITGPVGVARGRVAEPLVSRLLNDVGDNPDQLPILQHALMRTWDYWQCNRRNGEPLGVEHYEAIGTMSEALSRHADEAWNELPDQLSRWIAEVLFKALTERGPDNREIRRPTRLSEICKIAEARIEQVEAVIEVFRHDDRSFLMPPADVPLTPETIIDISHESLIRNWERLHKWVDEEAQSARIYRRLAEAAVLYRAGQEGLLNDPALQIALDWREDHRPNHAWANRYYADFDLAIAFLDASRAQRDAQLAEQERLRQEEIERERRELEMTRDFAEKQGRAALRLRRFTYALVIISLLAFGSAGGAAYAFRQAKKNEARAQEQRQIADTARQKAEELLKRVQAGEVALREESERYLKQKVAAEGAEQKALAALGLAKTEADRASKQAAIAAENFTKAEAARKEAVENAKQVVAAGKRGELLRKGMQAYRREKFKDALGFFEELRVELEALQPGGTGLGAEPNLKPEQAKQYAADLGWTLTNIGDAHQQEKSFAKAIESYKKALAVFNKILPEDSDDPILFATYDSLAQSYNAVARSRRHMAGQVPPDGNKSQEDFKQAEGFFQKALAFQVKHRPSEAAAVYLNLARLYVDSNKFDKAEENFNKVVESDDQPVKVVAYRELGEFYQGRGDYKNAILNFKKMIDVQENLTIGAQDNVNLDKLIDHGQEIANSYNYLGQIHRAIGEAAARKALKDKATTNDRVTREEAINKQAADYALRMADNLLRTSSTLREIRKSQGLPETSISSGLATNLDEMGNAWVTLGKVGYAESMYLEASRLRTESKSEQWKSYDRLAGFYREFKNDAAEAEKYKNLLGTAIKGNVDLLMQVGDLHSDDPYSEDDKKTTEAETYYRQALVIYERQKDWNGENNVFFRLSRLYLKQKRITDRQQAQRDRVEALGRYFRQLATNADTLPKDPINLMNQYLYAINAIAWKNESNSEADATYRLALDAFDYIAINIDNEKVLKFYAATLEDYDSLLKNKLNKEDEAATVKKKVDVVREKLRRLGASISTPTP
jgi:conflict system STAND superfamily ATPase/tetratricopeptide repeat protein